MAIFFVIWCCFVALGTLFDLQSILAGNTFWGMLSVSLAMLLFAFALAWGGFWFEVPRTKEAIS